MTDGQEEDHFYPLSGLVLRMLCCLKVSNEMLDIAVKITRVYIILSRTTAVKFLYII